MLYTNSIDQIKINKVLKIVERENPTAVESVKEQILTDHNDGQAHPDWFNSGEPQEIADYFLADFPGKN